MRKVRFNSVEEIIEFNRKHGYAYPFFDDLLVKSNQQPSGKVYFGRFLLERRRPSGYSVLYPVLRRSVSRERGWIVGGGPFSSRRKAIKWMRSYLRLEKGR